MAFDAVRWIMIAQTVARLVLCLWALILTMGLECGVGWLLGYRQKNALWMICGINLATNPVLNGILLAFPETRAWIVGMEGAIILIEWGCLIFFKKTLQKNAWSLLRLSAAMNLTSAILGTKLLKGMFALLVVAVGTWK